MNIRYAVLCARLRLRTRLYNRTWTDVQLREAEDCLGFSLPPMLRLLYTDVGALVLGPYALDWLPKSASHSGWRLAPAVVNELQRRPGSYITLNASDGDPGYFARLVTAGTAGDSHVVLDGLTGHLYFEDFVDDDSYQLSFCALSTEDWLERELDASWHVRLRYRPDTELASVLKEEGIHISDMTIRTNAADQSVHSFELENNAEATTQDAQPATAQLRDENLTDDPNPQARGVGSVYSYRAIKQAGWEIEQGRHHVLRQLYALMHVLEEEQIQARGQPIRAEIILQALHPLMAADAQLAPMVDEIQRGSSRLYDAYRRGNDQLVRQ